LFGSYRDSNGDDFCGLRIYLGPFYANDQIYLGSDTKEELNQIEITKRGLILEENSARYE